MSVDKAKNIQDVIKRLRIVSDRLEECEDFELMIEVCNCIDCLEDIKNPWHTGTPTEEVINSINKDEEYCFAISLWYDYWRLSDYLFRANMEDKCFESFPRGNEKVIRWHFSDCVAWQKIELYKGE